MAGQFLLDAFQNLGNDIKGKIFAEHKAHRSKAGAGTPRGMFNQIEVAILAYDPCLGCATHALGKMPLKVELEREGKVISEFTRWNSGASHWQSLAQR